MYRDLLALLQREALLALCVRALEIVCDEPRVQGKSKPRPMPRREAALFRKNFLGSLVRQQGWTIGQALDFQRDLQLYAELLARVAPTRAAEVESPSIRARVLACSPPKERRARR